MRPADLVMLRLQPHAMERRRGLLENLETRANRCFCCGSGVPCATCPRHAASLRRCGVLCLMGGRQHEYWPVKQHTQVPRPSYEKTERNSALIYCCFGQRFSLFWHLGSLALRSGAPPWPPTRPAAGRLPGRPRCSAVGVATRNHARPRQMYRSRGHGKGGPRMTGQRQTTELDPSRN